MFDLAAASEAHPESLCGASKTLSTSSGLRVVGTDPYQALRRWRGSHYYMGSEALNGDERHIRFELHREGHRRGSRQRAVRRSRRHAVPAGAEWLSAHRPRQVHLAQLRPGRRARGRALPFALRRHQSDQGNRRVRRLDHGRRALARLRLGPAPVLRLGLLPAALRLGRPAHPGGPRVRRRPERRGDERHPRHAHRAGPREPVAGSVRRGQPRPLRPDAGGGVPRRHARAARQDRHGLTEPEPARSHDVPDPQGGASPDGRGVVHLPDVRLRPRAVGLDRRRHALDLHAGVRGSPPAVRLVPRRSSASITRSRSSSPGSISATPC